MDVPDAPTPMSAARLIGLHLIPGALATGVFALIGPGIERAGYPPVLAFFLAVAVTIVPWELGTIALASRNEPGGALSAVRFRERLGRRRWLTLFPGVLLASLGGFLILSLTEPFLIDTLFAWMPTSFVELVPTDRIDAYSTSAWAITLVVYGAMNVFIGPIVEELYFRGYLLARMGHLGRWATLVNATLFSLYHFWSPWAFVSRVVGVLPFAHAVQRTRSVYLGVAVHVTLNGISTTAAAVTIVGALS